MSEGGTTRSLNEQEMTALLREWEVFIDEQDDYSRVYLFNEGDGESDFGIDGYITIKALMWLVDEYRRRTMQRIPDNPALDPDWDPDEALRKRIEKEEATADDKRKEDLERRVDDIDPAC